MRLPRRVPWSSIAELDQLCSWIFADENDLDTKVLAIDRLSAWRAITSLPHALESTLSLLVVISRDNSLQDVSESSLFLRQSYANALIRLVNGLVDPLQLGTYARSIASIAAQLGLPSWLVELRHAATHEDLPSLELLREAARESMSWLLHKYFLPTLNPSSVPPVPSATLRPLGLILKQYKGLLKITTRDISLENQYRLAISTVFKDIERWIAEAMVAANVAVGECGWDVYDSSEVLDNGDQDIKERWALERLCDALLEKGALVPLSKKKRIFPVDSFFPPKSSVLLWSPLLTHLQSLYPGLRILLSNRIVNHLLSDIQAQDSQTTPDTFRRDISFDICLARWVMWLIHTWEDTETEFDLQREITVTLFTAFGPEQSTSLSQDRKAAFTLLTALTSGNTTVEMTLTPLLLSPDRLSSVKWHPTDTDEMDRRLEALLSLDNVTTSVESRDSQKFVVSGIDSSVCKPGWRLLDKRTGWKPCPIGVYNSAAVV